MNDILSIRELTERLRQLIERGLPYVWVQGEVTNLSRPSSGHVYFSLKEGEAVLGCVWFKGQQRAQENFDPLTGEVWEGGPRPSPALTLENGQEVVCAGRLSVYGPRGAYQLTVELAQETGQGRQRMELEALKRKLAALGYFDESRKRPLPYGPGRVALITSPTGAAVHDFIRVSRDRGLPSRIRIHPVPVQGDEAPARISAAIEEANRLAWADVVVLARGGGSAQDLWAFNDERVARAVFESRLPVLAAVGHDIDRGLADFVADCSVSTPSLAAERLWPERKVLVQQVDGLEEGLRQAMARRLQALGDNLAQAGRALRLLSPKEKLKRQQERLEELGPRLAHALWRRMERAGYSLKSQTARLRSLGGRLLLPQERALEQWSLRLTGLSPYAPLARGYALARTPDGRFVRSVRDVAPGQALTLEILDGTIQTHVDGTLPRIAPRPGLTPAGPASPDGSSEPGASDGPPSSSLPEHA